MNLGPDGRPALSSEPVTQQKQSLFNTLADWTPEILTRQLFAFQRGDIRALAWVMEWLELHDDTISSVAPKAEGAVSRHRFDMKSRGEIPPTLKWPTTTAACCSLFTSLCR